VKVLWIKADKLLPLHGGGNIRSYNILRQLAFRHEVTLFSYYAGAPDREYEVRLKKDFPAAICLATRKLDAGVLRRRFDYLVRLPRRAPYAVSRADSASVRVALKPYFDGVSFDLVVCDFLLPTISIPVERSVPMVLFQHNVESEIWRRHVEVEANPLLKFLYRIELIKMQRFEIKMVRAANHVIAVSQHDRALMIASTDSSRISVVPTGVDLEEYSQRKSKAEPGSLLMFVGSMDSKPNVDGVMYFCKEIWPLILRKVPLARFRIVGRDPAPAVLKLASASVEVTGTVASISNELCHAAVVVVPLRIGGGTRLKIYEAMAMATAVVSTTVGAEGLDVTDGRDVLLRDGPQEFADGCVSLLQDIELRHRIGNAGAQLAGVYDWPVIGDEFSDVLQKVVEDCT
jgi:glycosyltransferase involved in cell wall biosynthesis